MYRGSKDHLNYMNKWSKEHRTAFTVKFNNDVDSAVIDKLNTVENRTAYLRKLILADIGSTRQ